MWARFRTHFKGFPAQEKVAQIMVLYGLRVHEGHVFCGDIKVSDTAMARATGVDRRVGNATVATIEKTPELRAFFDKLHPVCHLRDVDQEVNLARIRRVLQENDPFLSGKDTDPWADERNYICQDGPQALHEFTAARLKLLDLLEAASPQDWERTARHAILGPTPLQELVGIIAEHDRLHIRQVTQDLFPNTN